MREDPPASPQTGTQLSAAPFTGAASGKEEAASPSEKPEEADNPRATRQTADTRGPEAVATTTAPKQKETADDRGPEAVADPPSSPQEEDPPLRSTPALRVHLQGTFLLIVLLLVLWAALDWAGSVIGSAAGGPDGAIVAKAPTESDESSGDDGGSAPDEPLGGNEVADLQAALARFGYEPGPVDGIMGELTRSAIAAAKSDLSLPAASDRLLLETLAAAIEALDDAPTDLGS